MGNVLFEGFQYSNHHLLFLAICPDVEMLQFQSVNYICQVCELYFYFGHFVQNFYLSSFSKLKVFQFQLLLNICCIAIVRKAVFFCTFGGKEPLFCDEKLFKVLLYFAFILSQNSTIDSRKTSINQEWLVVESYLTPC